MNVISSVNNNEIIRIGFPNQSFALLKKSMFENMKYLEERGDGLEEIGNGRFCDDDKKKTNFFLNFFLNSKSSTTMKATKNKQKLHYFSSYCLPSYSVFSLFFDVLTPQFAISFSSQIISSLVGQVNISKLSCSFVKNELTHHLCSPHTNVYV